MIRRLLGPIGIGRLSVSLEYKPADLWVGAYWARGFDLHVWVCLVPCLPIHFEVAHREVWGWPW